MGYLDLDFFPVDIFIWFCNGNQRENIFCSELFKAFPLLSSKYMENGSLFYFIYTQKSHCVYSIVTFDSKIIVVVFSFGFFL